MSHEISPPHTFDKLPGVFSFQRSLMVSDGLFYDLHEDGKRTPLPVVRHGIRGTQAKNGEAAKPKEIEEKDSTSEMEEQSVSAIQRTETAKSHANGKAVLIEFGLRSIGLDHALFACAAKEVAMTKAVRESVQSFVTRAKSSMGLEEVANRIARNIANGSWIWRNRTSAHTLVVDVFLNDQKETLATFNALAVPLNSFDNFTESEKSVGRIIANGFRGDVDANLRILATLHHGIVGAVEVFPSQAFVEEKTSGFARPLYRVPMPGMDKYQKGSIEGSMIVGQAAFRDQKISNRLRTIDTWYESFPLIGKPIPIEPNGASLEFMEFFRDNTGTNSAFNLLRRLGTMDPNSDEGMFCIGLLVRGGVFSGGKEKDEEKEAKKVLAAEKKAAKKKTKDGEASASEADAASAKGM